MLQIKYCVPGDGSEKLSRAALPRVSWELGKRWLVGGVGLVRESQNIWRKKDHGMLKGIPSWEFSLLLWGRERLEACGGHKIGREEMCR